MLNKHPLYKEILDKYDIRLNIDNTYHSSLLDFYEEKGYLTVKQVKAIKYPNYSYSGQGRSDDDCLGAMAFEHGSQ